MMTLDNLSWVLILISAIIKGIALKNISNTNWDVPTRKKNYWKWNIASYLFLIPGAILLIWMKWFA